MLTNFTNKCNKLVHINIKFMQKLEHAKAHLTKFTYKNVTTYVVHINIKIMQKLEHAQCSCSLRSQINVIS